MNFSCRMKGNVSRTKLSQVSFRTVQQKKNSGIVLLDHYMLYITLFLSYPLVNWSIVQSSVLNGAVLRNSKGISILKGPRKLKIYVL